MYVLKAVAPGDGCTFTSEESEAFIGHGRYVIGAPAPYRIIPQIKSKLTADDDRLEARTIQIHGARVNLTFADPSMAEGIDESLLRFQSLFSAPLEPNGGVTDAIFDLIPEGLSKALAAKLASTTTPVETEVIAKLTVYGDIVGSEVVSQEWQFPVTMCTDCILKDLGPCSELSPSAVVRPGNACSPYQDGVADCCSDGNDYICPAEGTAVD